VDPCPTGAGATARVAGAEHEPATLDAGDGMKPELVRRE